MNDQHPTFNEFGDINEPSLFCEIRKKTLEHAKERNAKIYAEIVGYGSNCDAYNMVSPDYDGLTCAKAMNRALKDANKSHEQVAQTTIILTPAVLSHLLHSTGMTPWGIHHVYEQKRKKCRLVCS